VRLTPDVILKFAEVGQALVTYGLAVLLFSLKRPNGRLLRGFLSVLAAWAAGVIYTIYVYNPAGIAAGHYTGMDFPENHYDNNTVAVALIAGWVGPAIILSIIGAFRAMRDDVGLRSTERTPNTSLERTRDK
jgi:NO-binding membrane sensor protein with MHYT domain